MRSAFLSVLLILLLGLVFLLNCNSEDSDQDLPQNDAFLEVEPSASISLGYFQEQVFKIKLVSADGAPAADEPIFISFTEPAHNAHLDPTELYTDSDGIGEVVFTAPDQAAQFPIRFSTPSAPEPNIINVTIDPALLQLALQIHYEGERNFETIEASLYEETNCQNLYGESGQDPLEVLELSSLPTTLGFDGLRSNRTYSIEVKSFSQSGEIRAYACVDDLVPNEGEPVVTLADVPFEFSGKYSIITTIETDGALDSTINELAVAADGSGFLSNPATAILDALKTVLAENYPLSEEPFEAIRNEYDLDGRLKGYFEEISVDISAVLDPAWLSTLDHLEVVTTKGSLEFGSPYETVFPISHKVDQIAFGNEAGEFVQIDVSDSEAGIGAAKRDDANGDIILLTKHKISLGLGTLVYRVLVNAGLKTNFETTLLSEALAQTVRCDQVADFLSQWLLEITNKPTIESGCRAAALEAEQMLVWGVPALDEKYRDLSFEGVCRLEEPAVGNQVQSLVNGTSEVTWEGVSFSGDDELLGPMEAVFEAVISSDP